MKNLSYFFVICFIFTACNKGNEPIVQEEPCSYIEDERIQPLLDCMNMPRPEDSYCYPCQGSIGDGEWYRECCYCQRWNEDDEVAFQIPVSILEEMSTQAVIQAIWEHPRFIYMIDFWAFQYFLEIFFSHNNAYMELMKRPDAGTALLERLVLVNFLGDLPYNHAPWSLEVFMSQPVFLSQLNDEERKKIVESTLKNIDIRNDGWECDCSSIYYTSYILIGRMMLLAGYAPFAEAVNEDQELKSFLDGWKGDHFDSDFYIYLFTPSYIHPTINNFSKDFLNNK